MLKNALFVGSESQRKWKSEIKYILGELCSDQLSLNEIDAKDAKNILSKIESFGPWTRLSKMSQNQRINELVHRSKRQLLIGLMETTSGDGFEKIIENDYLNVSDTIERNFIILVGLATIHKYFLKDELASRALSFLGCFESVNKLAKNLEGIISYKNNKLLARHPVYIRHLFNEVVESENIQPVLFGLLSAFTVYASPIYRNVKKNELQLYKALINHKFLKDIFRSKSNLILPIYEYFEKDFENDGHFLLQYGLALRDVNQHPESLEKMKTALLAFPTSSHIEHALAQQELIIACTSATKAKAYDLLDSAKDRLENLNRYFKSRNAYPIVTLSDGHTRIIKKFEGDDQAIQIAKYYANRISSVEGFMEHHRLKSTWSTLTQFATTGFWNENGFDSIECYFPDN